MTEQSCCKVIKRKSGVVANSRPIRRQYIFRRYLGFGQWLMAGFLLTLFPKCVVCLAAYMLIGSSLGFSLITQDQKEALAIPICGMDNIPKRSGIISDHLIKFGKEADIR